jgi:hypothetical protein
VREEADVEALRRLIELDGAADLEANAPGQAGRQRLPGLGDRLKARVDREDGACNRGVPEGQPAIAAANLENARAVQIPDRPKSRHLGAFGINHVGLESHWSPWGLPVVGGLHPPLCRRYGAVKVTGRVRRLNGR